jgi:hypothetical protein
MTEKQYDSAEDTKAHIRRVWELASRISECLMYSVHAHDASKLEPPEKTIFDEFTPKLKGMTYGSEEYKACLAAMKPALDHHYAGNRHHPEYYPNGVDGMTLMELVEMFCDWKAATERHANGDLSKSIRINSTRFKIGPQLEAIFRNTKDRMDW